VLRNLVSDVCTWQFEAKIPARPTPGHPTVPGRDDRCRCTLNSGTSRARVARRTSFFVLIIPIADGPLLSTPLPVPASLPKGRWKRRGDSSLLPRTGTSSRHRIGDFASLQTRNRAALES